MTPRNLAYVAGAVALALTVAPTLGPGPSGARAEGLQRDSDDFNCHHGPLDSRLTLQACARLMGEPVSRFDVAALREGGHARDSDDLNCHRGAPGDRRAADACARLRR